MSIKNLETIELFDELKSRGFHLDLIISNDSISEIFNYILEDMLDEGQEKIELDSDGINEILGGVSFDWIGDRIGEEIYDSISSYIHDKLDNK